MTDQITFHRRRIVRRMEPHADLPSASDVPENLVVDLAVCRLAALEAGARWDGAIPPRAKALGEVDRFPDVGHELAAGDRVDTLIVNRCSKAEATKRPSTMPVEWQPTNVPVPTLGQEPRDSP